MDDPQSVETADPALDTERDLRPRHINSVDATTGQPIVARVMARKTELELLLDGLPEGDLATQRDIYLALATINDLLTGDLEHVPAVVAIEMNRWLERNKHLAERAAMPVSSGDNSRESGDPGTA